MRLHFALEKLREWLSNIPRDFKSTTWITNSIEEAHSMIKDYEIETVSKFSVGVVDKYFGTTG